MYIVFKKQTNKQTNKTIHFFVFETRCLVSMGQ